MGANLNVIFGPCGAGKTTYAHAFARREKAVAGVLAVGTPVILDIGLMRKADRARVREIGQATGLDLRFHFVDAPAEVRRARVLDRNVVRGEGFAIEVTPDLFEFIEGVYEAPEPEELTGAVMSLSD